MNYAELQIATIHSKPIDWVTICTFSTSNGNAHAKAVIYGSALRGGFFGSKLTPPNLRILDKDGKDIGGWE